MSSAITFFEWLNNQFSKMEWLYKLIQLLVEKVFKLEISSKLGGSIHFFIYDTIKIFMSKNWYPMINYEKCADCGTCVAKYSHGVYKKEKAPHPIVIFPEGCIEGCKGCGNICPNDAIEYFGDNTFVYEIGCSCNE